MLDDQAQVASLRRGTGLPPGGRGPGRRPPDRLPAPLSSFVGRRSELRTLTRLVGANRLVTLTGSGGCGKSRLAREVAESQLDAHRGGTWWVELAPLREGAQVAEQLAGVVGLGTLPGVDATRAVTRRLSGAGPVLVVLDNAEHLVGPTADLVEALLSGCPDARALVTSREPLRVPGEVVWRVPSLSVPPPRPTAQALEEFDASRLFVERAREQRPTLVLDDDACAAVASICARLDGVPLALELAAARARSMPLTSVAAGLDDVFGLLTGGARTALPRQRTLFASIRWSVDLLEALDRVVLRRLAVFHGPFTLEAAGAVAAGAAGDLSIEAGEAVDGLTRLVDRSLVQFEDGAGRYRLLEAVRQFGLERLAEAGELEATRHRHAAWWAHWCDEAGRGRHGLVAHDLAWAMPDVVAAEEWSRATDLTDLFRIQRGLGWFRPGLGNWAQLERSYDAVVAAPPERRDGAWAAALAALGWPGIMLLRRDGLELLPAAAPLLGDDPGAQVLARWAPAFYEAFAGRLDGMRALAGDVVAAGDELAYPHVVGALLSVAQHLGHYEEAEPLLDRLVALLRRRGQRFGCDTAMAGHFGAVFMLTEQGRFARALELVDETGPTDPTFVVASAAATVTLAAATGDLDLLERAERWLDRDYPPVSQDTVDHVLGSVALARRQPEQAAERYLQCLSADAFDVPIKYFNYRRIMSAIVGVGRVAEARERVDRAVAHLAELGDPPLPLVSVLLSRSFVRAAEGLESEAWADAHRALALAHRRGFALARLDALEWVAVMAARRGRAAAAARLLGASGAERGRLGYRQRIVPDPAELDQLVARLHVDEAAAFAQGGAATLDDIVAYAGRALRERSRATFGWDALTPTERQVAGLVAQGLANAQIATTLLMSPATVKSHLTHAYAKLGISNRTELASLHLRRTATGGGSTSPNADQGAT